MSPDVEEQYKELSRDYDNDQACTATCWRSRARPISAPNMEKPAARRANDGSAKREPPEQPAFPARPLFAGGRSGRGPGHRSVIAIFLEFSDKSIRTERDASAAMDLPLLISVPWVGPEEELPSMATGNAAMAGGDSGAALRTQRRRR